MASRKKSIHSGRQRRHWSLLLIGGHGETITIGRVKGLIITLAIVTVAMLIAASVLFYANRQLVVANANLQNSLAEMKSRLVSLKNDRDLYMTRLVAAESGIERLREGKGEKTMPADPAKAGKEDHRSEEAGDAEQDHVGSEIVVAIESSALKKDLSVETGQSGLDVENFTLICEASIQTLRTGYRIKITDHLIERIIGRTIVVLKSGVAEHFKWLTLPKIELDQEGQPVNWQKGQLFSISNFRDIALEARSQYPAKEFTLATVFVFSETGDLLLKKDFALDSE